MLSDPSDLVRAEAIEALGILREGSGEHHEDLVSLLGDVKKIVRIAAIESLVLIQDARSIPKIAACLKDADSLVRAFAAVGLAELGCKNCFELIADALSHETDDAAAAGFLVALVMLGDGTKLKQLFALLLSDQYRVRCFVANWLLRLNLNGEQIKAARAMVKEAFRHPLGRADASTMASVLKGLSLSK
jgi:HEAT repeat protein